MKIEGMSIARGAMNRLAAIAALAIGWAIASPAQADDWRAALHDADDLHHAAHELHERALRLHDHHVMPYTAALDEATADLYHGLKHHPCAAEIVPLVHHTQSALNQTASAIALNCAMHTDRKAVALLKDVRHHFFHTNEHIEDALHDHHHSRHRTPPVYYSQPAPAYSPSPYGTYYSAPPAWTAQPSPPILWEGGYRGASHSHSNHQNAVPRQAVKHRYSDDHGHDSHSGVNTRRPLARVLISELLVK